LASREEYLENFVERGLSISQELLIAWIMGLIKLSEDFRTIILRLFNCSWIEEFPILKFSVHEFQVYLRQNYPIIMELILIFWILCCTSHSVDPDVSRTLEGRLHSNETISLFISTGNENEFHLHLRQTFCCRSHSTGTVHDAHLNEPETFLSHQDCSSPRWSLDQRGISLTMRNVFGCNR